MNGLRPESIKLIAFDLDGTLFNRHAQISDRTTGTLAKVAELGVQLVIASGRSQRSILPRVEGLPFVQWAICSNGATRYDLVARQPAKVELMAAEHIQDLVDAVQAVVPEAVWAWESTTSHVWTESFVQSQLSGGRRQRVVADHTGPGTDTLKVVVGHPDIDQYELLDRVAPMIPHGLTASTSGAPFVEVTGPGVTKAKGLAELCHDLDIDPGSTAAFGDNVNDIEMLRWVGYGVAMANAHPRLKAVAENHTDRHHDEDGVADALERLFSL